MKRICENDDLQPVLEQLLQDRESGDMEFKSAKGGFPHSMWETYSSSANTDGGAIVFGIKEKDEQFFLDGLTEAQVKKDVNVALPDVNVALPDVNVALPDGNVALPDSNVALSNANVALPGANVGLPDSNVGLTGGNVGLPGSNVGLPDSNVGLTGGNVGLPGSNVGLPDSNVGLPGGNVGLPGSNVGLPDSNVGLPGGNVGLPGGKVGLPSPNVGLTGGNVGLPGSNVGLPDGNIGLRRKRYSKEELRDILVSFCTQWKTAEEIALYVGRNLVYIRDRVLPQMSDVIEKMYDIPHHPRQKYRAKQQKESEE